MSNLDTRTANLVRINFVLSPEILAGNKHRDAAVAASSGAAAAALALLASHCLDWTPHLVLCLDDLDAARLDTTGLGITTE